MDVTTLSHNKLQATMHDHSTSRRMSYDCHVTQEHISGDHDITHHHDNAITATNREQATNSNWQMKREDRLMRRICKSKRSCDRLRGEEDYSSIFYPCVLELTGAQQTYAKQTHNNTHQCDSMHYACSKASSPNSMQNQDNCSMVPKPELVECVSDCCSISNSVYSCCKDLTQCSVLAAAAVQKSRASFKAFTMNRSQQATNNHNANKPVYSNEKCAFQSSYLNQSGNSNNHNNNVITTASYFKLLFIIVTYLTSSVTCQTWAVPPQDSSAKLGNSVTLFCAVSNLQGNSITWLQSNDDGSDTKILFLNDGKFEDDVPDRYSVSAHTSSGAGVEGYDLTLSQLVQGDDKTYECSVQGMSDGKKEAKVTVLVAPGVPAISADKDLADLAEGNTIILTCTTTGGNPQPTIRWYRNQDDTEIQGTVVTPPSIKFGTTTSALTWLLAREDHRATFRCTAENQANTGQPVEQTQVLNVQYAPVLDVGIHNPLHVIEEDDITLLCNVDANPAVSSQDVQWLDQNGFQLGQGFEYTLSSIQASQAGIYQCRAENTIRVSTTDLTIDVQYGPKVTLQYSQGSVRNMNQLHVTENQPLNLSCGVDANPRVDVSGVEWRKGDVTIHIGAYYYFASVHRDNTGEYSCHVTNTLTPSGGSHEQHTGADTLQLFVQYPPGKATVFLPAMPIKNENAEVTCSVNDLGFPTAELQWRKIGSENIIDTGPALTFTPLELWHTGDYRCTPQNTIGTGLSDTQTLDVMELPEWISHTLEPKLEVLINQTDLSIRCGVRGNPSPRVLWYKDDTIIEDPAQSYFKISEYRQAIDTHSWNVTSILHWKGSGRTPYDSSLLPEDTGMYRCHVISDIDATGLSATSNVLVYYPPIVDSPSEKVAVDVNQPAVFQCRAHSRPETSFVWYNGTNRLLPGSRVTIEDAIEGGEFPYTTTMTISAVLTHDFGVYTCVATNTIGTGVLAISLTVKTVPDPPTKLIVLSKTWESVMLSWEPGFDGGYPQSFVIAYTSKTAPAGQTEVNGQNQGQHNVTLLYPSSNYTFAVFGRNSLGPGGVSNLVAATTEYFYIEPPTTVVYDPNTNLVTFESPSTHYCARIDTFNGEVWQNYIPCAPTEGGSVKIAEDLIIDAMHVALCLTTRQDVCSDNGTAEMVEQEEDLPTYVVVIIGVICAIIVITLLVVLIILCCKRRNASKDDAEETNKPTAAVKPQQPNGQVTQRPSHLSYDNPSLDKSHSPIDERMMNTSGNGPVFTTEASHPSYDYYNGKPNGNIPNGGHHHPHLHQQHQQHQQQHQQQQPHSTYLYDNNTNVQRERSFKGDGSSNPGQTRRERVDSGSYNVQNNRHNPDKAYLYLEDPRAMTHNNSGDGSTGSDHKPPKKVMYEVVV